MFHIGIVGDNHSAFTRSHVLSWVEGEGSCSSPFTSHAAVEGGEVSLSSIFKNCEVVLLANLFKAIHIGNMAIKVDRHDRLGPWSDE